jgi:periplasmic divalent cation tolerance protein
MTKFCFTYVTTKDKAEAVKIGKALVEEKLAACVNILEGMTSIYFWEGKLNQEQECVLIVKTKALLIDKVIKQVKKLHSYSNPCVVSLPIENGSSNYLKWLSGNTI